MNTAGPPADDAALRPLTIDLDDLAFALTWHDDYQGSSHWLNLDTGEVVFVADPGDLDSMAEDPRDDQRFVRIDAIDSWQSFRIMEDFVEQLGDAALARRLGRALAQRKPFRHFKDELARHLAQREAWFAFEHAALERLARQWCAACGVAPHWTSRRKHAAPDGES
ncbi:UPF0158 family protein [Sphaerotilus sp.]|uniref:UPF0158 family protein n=1 Tax=Sphaerotilus sp. TaxID=2093942 RepID=UPI002ACE25EE|nr:UPF0158 family protein [Sphaerotilus sp.]MDZ7855841.1 UPF0158 family protein [Sphaerotilus sp.]